MDPQQFDALTRRLSSAGSRRRVLTALVTGAFGRVLVPPGIDVVAAGCKNFNQSCTNSPCCKGNSGLRCRDGRCRCKKGWKHCLEGGICQNLNTDPDHCGECHHACPTGCCVKGKCREMCGGECCADCFVPVMSDGDPDEDNPICCKSSGGTICEYKKPGKADDRCCYENQICLNGKCCCNNCEGARKCGVKCCAITACCNGKCCEKGYVCATKNGKKTCVRANRDCGPGKPPCFTGEICHGGRCCSGLRVCGDGVGNPVCCNAGEYCEFQQDQQIAECCPINTICKGTYRGHRVRR